MDRAKCETLKSITADRLVRYLVFGAPISHREATIKRLGYERASRLIFRRYGNDTQQASTPAP
jgi:hypothetical protein